MALKKITFDGSSVSAAQDAVLNYFLCGSIAGGILEGIGSSLSYSVSNNYITFQDGYVQIYGRRIYVESGSQVYISLDSSKYGYVIIDVDLSTNSATLTKVEGSSTYPTLTQDNLLSGGTRYQLPIAKYIKSTSAISLQSFERTMIPTPLSVARSGYSSSVVYVQNNYKVIHKVIPTQQSGTTYRYDMSGIPVSSCLITINIANNVFITIPGMFMTGHSTSSINYRLWEVDYSLTCEWLPGSIILLDTNSAGVAIKSITAVQIGE
jgi:hypothetical protein